MAAHYNETLLAMQTAICYSEAGQPQRAVELYRQWLSPAVFSRRDYGYFLALMAATVLAVGDPDEAASVGAAALSIAAATESVRTLHELLRLRADLVPWSDRTAVRDFCMALPG